MSNDYEKIREKVAKDFKEKIEEKDRKINYLRKLVTELEARNRELEVENAGLRNKVARRASGLPMLLSTTELVERYSETYEV